MVWENYELRFIELVKQNPVIYERLTDQPRRLRESLIKDAWDNIANKFGRSPEQCKKRWKSIRTSYIRLQKNIRLGKKNLDPKSKYLDGVLSFLDSEIDYSISKEKVNVDVLSKRKKSEENIYYVNQEIIQSLLKNKSKESDLSDMADGSFKELVDEKLKLLMNCNKKHPEQAQPQDDNNFKTTQTDNYSKSQNSTKSLKSTTNNDVIEISSMEESSDAVFEYDVEETIEKKSELKWVRDLNGSEADTKEFFTDLSQLVSLLPLEEQTKIRLKICSLVTKAEIEVLEKEGM